MANDLIRKHYPVVPQAAAALDGYIASAYALPVLDAEEEYALAERYRSENDIQAAHTLVTHNLRFVVQVARGYSGYGLPLGDLIQEGNIGLMKAVKRFDPEVGVRLVSFAVHWIRAEIHEFILKHWRIVKVATTKSQRKLFFNLRSMKKRLAWLNPSEVREVASQLGVKPKDVVEMEQRLSARDLSFDPLPDGDEEEASCAPSLYLADPNAADPAEAVERDDWRTHCRRQFKQALAALDPRSLEILKARHLATHKATLHELAEKYQVSAERIRQIESQAIAKLKRHVAEAQ